MNRLRGIVYLINGISWLFVTKAFFHSTRYGESINKILLSFLIMFSLLILSYFTLPYPLVSQLSAGIWIIFSIVLVSISTFCWAKGFLAARYFSIGMLLLAVGWFGFHFQILGWLSLSTWQLNFLMTVQFIVVLLFFSFALIDRYHLAEKKMLQHQKEALDRMGQVDRLQNEIIARKRIENDLRTANQHFIGLLDIWETGIIIIDHQQTIQFFNLRAEELLGYRHHEVVTRPIDTIFPFSDVSTDQLINRQAILTATRADHSIIPVDIVITPIDVNGNMAYALLF